MPFYNWSKMERTLVSPQYSTAEGPTIKGRDIEVGRYRFAARTGSKPHKHPEEQVISVLSGNFRVRVAGEERILEAGDAVLIPPNTEHEASAMETDAEILSCKNIVAHDR
jgi:quercetin dioxygenase-like cupin family protein